MNALDVLYEELAKDEDVPNDVDEEIDTSSWQQVALSNKWWADRRKEKNQIQL